MVMKTRRKLLSGQRLDMFGLGYVTGRVMVISPMIRNLASAVV
jgi:hypothetical protein